MSDPESCEEAFFLTQGTKPEEIKAYQAMTKTWAQTDEEAEKAVHRIVVAAAERAKVLFDRFGFQWGTKESRGKPYKEHEYEVPSIERIIENLERGVQDTREHGLSGGSGRLSVVGDTDEYGDLTSIRLFFELGHIPIEYLWENGPMVAKRMELQNQSCREVRVNEV